MGTNYYYEKNKERIHIGKLSARWKFHLAFDSFKNHINWKRELVNKKIYDEYEKIYTYDELITIIESKKYVLEPKYSKQSKRLIEIHPRFKPLNINGYIFIKGEWS